MLLINTIHFLTTEKCGFSTFKYFATQIPSLRAVYRTALGYQRLNICTFEGDYQFCITQNSNIGIVRNNYDLSAFLYFLEISNDRLLYKFTIEVIFWLID